MFRCLKPLLPLVVFSVIPAAAQEAPDLIAEGKRLYEWLCMDCHAPGATGDIGSDIRGEGVDSILTQVENQDEMQGLPVDQDRATALAAYLASRKPAP